MLITRGFGTGTAEGPGGYVYVPITEPIIRTNELGYKTMSGDSKFPNFISDNITISPPDITSNKVNTQLDVTNLKPKITTNTPKV